MNRFSELIRIHSVKSSRRIQLDIPADACLFLLIKYGSGHLQTQRQLLPFVSGSAYLLSDESRITLISGNSKEISICFLTVSEEVMMMLDEDAGTAALLAEFFRPALSKSPSSDSYCKKDLEIFAHYETLLLYAQQDADLLSGRLFDHLALSLLIFAAGHYAQNRTALQDTREVKPSQKLVFAVTDSINRRYAEDLSLHILAEEAYTSPSYLSRIFKEVNGITVSAYINQVRLANVKRLLSTTDDLIVDIASACGYNYIPYFNQLFHRTVGMTPTQYRQKHRKKKYPHKTERRI
ncbi:MAG: helix-turn-helix transcriptional regulator [Lachnospiraceae bacterium]|nr:helix-turn-helix transcriptional regulator [Lachnospiraceae bacterium]